VSLPVTQSQKQLSKPSFVLSPPTQTRQTLPAITTTVQGYHGESDQYKLAFTIGSPPQKPQTTQSTSTFSAITWTDRWRTASCTKTELQSQMQIAHPKS